MKIPSELLFRTMRKTPVFLANEVSECGLACLAMVGAYHGHDIDLNGLRQRASISVAGANLRGLMQLADQLGLSARALRVELSALGELPLPAIVHWDMTHFVVLEAVGRREIVVHDPSSGRRKLSVEEFSNHFTGVILELRPSDTFEPIESRISINFGHLWSGVKGITQSLVFVLILSAALQLVAFIAPFQMQVVVDGAIGHQDANLLFVVVFGFAIVGVLGSVITATRDWTLQLFGTQFVFQVSGNVFRHLIRLPSDYFEKRHLGDILSRFGSLRTIQDSLTQGILSALIDGGMALCAALILFFYSPPIALVVIASVALICVLNIATLPYVRRQTEQWIIASSREQSIFMETIRGALTIKLMGAEAERHSIWRNVFSKSFNGSVAMQRTQVAISFAQSSLLTLQGALVVYLGAQSVLSSGGMSVGMLYAFLSFSGVFTGRSIALINQAQKVGMLRLYFERLADITGTVPEVAIGAPIVPLPPTLNVSLCDVGFRYGATDPLILKNVSFEIEDQDFVAIVGPTGGGKSTLLKLLLGLQAPTEGKILIGGEQASPGLWQQWRTKAGVVRQDDQLLSGSLADNISFYDPDLDMTEVRKSAALAAVNEDIIKMPMGYLTQVGDMGSNLSGGQRQRVLLARALYRKPQILILDEGTANLDADTEDAIADMIDEMPVTRIVVAHRPALVGRAKKVFRVDQGLVERIR